MRQREPIVRKQTYDTGVLYLDDIVELQSTIEAAGFRISFYDDLYEYDSLDDVMNHKGPNITSMHWYCKSEVNAGSIVLLFERGLVATRSDGFSKEVKALRTELDSALTRRKSHFAKLKLPSLWAGGLIGSLPGVIVILWLSSWTEFWFLAFAACWAVGLLWSLLAPSARLAVYLDRAHTRSTFWRRNFDRIVMLIIGTFLGVLAKFLYDLLAKRHSA